MSGGAKQAEAQWVDVTSAMKRGCAALKLPEVLQCNDFTLASAISAVEVSDSRMDHPMTEAMHLPSLLAAGRMPLEISMAQAASLLNQLVCNLMQWWSGQHLSQTLHTCLYLLVKEDVAHLPVLGAITAVFSQLISVTHELVSLSAVLLEEDCPTNMPALAPEPLQIAATAEQLAVAYQVCEEAEDTVAGAAVKTRLQMLLALLQCIGLLISGASPGKAKLQLDKAFAALKAVRAEERGADGDAWPAAPGFCKDLYYACYAMPPPPLKPMSVAAAQDEVEGVLQQLERVHKVTALSTLKEVMDFVAHFGQEGARTVVKAVLLLVVLPQPRRQDDELPAWVPCTRHYMQELCLPMDLLAKNKMPYLETFVGQLHIAVTNHISALCMNRTRTRRRLRKSLVDWEHMRLHALNADHSNEMLEFLSSGRSGWKLDARQLRPCTLCVEQLTSICMLQHLLLGFQLTLYAASEISTVLCYCYYLFSTLQGSMVHFMRSRPKELKSPSKKGKGKGKAQKKNADGSVKAPENEVTPAEEERLSREQFQISVVEIQQGLCAAIMGLSTTLEALGIVVHASPAYGSADARFLQRFECFQGISVPRFIEYRELEEFMNGNANPDAKLHERLGPPLQAFKKAATLASQICQARKNLEPLVQRWELDEVGVLLTVARRNSTACTLLLNSSGMDNAPRFAGTWEFTLHKWFPTLKLSVSEPA